MKRYDISSVAVSPHVPGLYVPDPREDAEGEWVRYEDAIAHAARMIVEASATQNAPWPTVAEAKDCLRARQRGESWPSERRLAAQDDEA